MLANQTSALTDDAQARQSFKLSTYEFNIPAGDLSPALQKWAEVSNLKLLAPSQHVRNLTTGGLSGAFTPEQALKKLLIATTLKYEITGSQIGVYDPASAHAARAQANSVTLPRMEVRTVRRKPAPRPAPPPPAPPPAPSINPNSALVSPPPYAGGQVATGGRLGLLGSRNVMDTPFSQTSYTAKTIQDQQARTIADVVANDPSVRVKTPSGNGVDGLYIRGFYYDSGDYALNGLYGLAPFYSSGANFVDRVEVLKGPGALLSGMPPAGAIGGSINLVTKTAPFNYDITQLTATSKSEFGFLTDVSRRYGQNKEWGIRFNGGYRGGSTVNDRQKEEFGDAVLNVDYQTERARFSADIGYQAQSLDPPLRFLTFTNSPPFTYTMAVPPLPTPGTNYMPSWATWKPQDTFAMFRGEIDLTKNVTIYGAYGYHRSLIDYNYASPRLLNTAGAWTAVAFKGQDIYGVSAGDTGARISFDTGPVSHQVTVNYSSVERDYTSYAKSGGTIVGSLYGGTSAPLPASYIQNAQALETQTRLSSVGFADTMSILNKRVQFIAGARRQTASVDSQTLLTSAGPFTSADSSVWSPSFAAIFKPIEPVSLYANYIEGLKSPEVVTGGTTYSNVGEILPAFQTKQKEVGIKVDFGRITTTLAAFDITMPNAISVSNPGFTLPAKKLSGEQRNRGIELYAFGEITPTFRVLGGVTFMEGEVVKSSVSSGPTIISYDGKTPVGVSKVNVNMGAEWDTWFVRDLTLTGRVIYTGKQFANDANTQELPDWTRVDIGARYTVTSPWNGKPIVLRANIENLFDKAYWVAYRTVSSAVALGAPRTYLASATFNF